MNAPTNLIEFNDLTAGNQQSLPFAQQIVTVTLPHQEYVQLKTDAGRYKGLHQRALKKIAKLEEELKQERAKVRDLTHRLYGKKSEKSTTKADLKANVDKKFVGPPSPFPVKRGAKKRRPNRPRKTYPHLPIVHENIELTPEQSCCPECGKDYAILSKTEDSKIIEVPISAHIRYIHRKMGKPTCKCPMAPPLVTAPTAPRVYPKATIGVSTWTIILLDKFQSYTPSNRLYQRLENQGADISAGTVTNGLQKIMPLFEPIRQAMQIQQNQEELFHNDETGWKVFEAVKNKVGYKWFLWVTRSASVINFTMATGRSAEVIEGCFVENSAEKMIIVCDRYSSYKKFAKNKDHVILAFCWAHVRRDFLDAARKRKKNNDWMFRWVDDIGELYHLNNLRLKHWDQKQPLSKQSKAFAEKHEKLKQKVSQFKEDFEQARKDEEPKIDKETNKKEPKTDRFKVLNSLKNHWEGLTVFVDNPQVPMDNNPAEQALRMPVAGRRSFYGSGSVWSAKLAAILMGWIKTLITLWCLNPHTWIQAYLQACAENGSRSPEDLSCFLPWMMNEEQKSYFSRPYSDSTPIPKAKINSKDAIEIQDSS